jgi:hypothetical protein
MRNQIAICAYLVNTAVLERRCALIAKLASSTAEREELRAPHAALATTLPRLVP